MSSNVSSLFSSYLLTLRGYLTRQTSRKDLYQAVVDAPFSDKISASKVDLGIVVLLLVNKSTGMIDRVALSDTELAKQAVNMSAKPFKAIKIPLDTKKNAIAEAVRTHKIQRVSDWQYLFAPALTPQQARLNQAGAGIECSLVSPLESVGDGGALIFSFYQPPTNITKYHTDFVKGYSRLASEALSSL